MTSRRWLIAVVLAGCTDPHHTSTLVRVDQETAGANCEFGGVAVNTGADTDDSGSLDDSEITSTEYVCNGASVVKCGTGTKLEGTITIGNQADLAQLAGVSCIDGDLIVAGTSLTAMPELADLTTVTGGVVVAGNDALTTLDDLDGLRDIGLTYLIQGNDALTDVSAISTLERVKAVSIVGNSMLANLSGLEPITTLNFGLAITGNPSLTSLQGLDNVTTAKESMFIRSNRSLTSLAALGNLRSIPQLEISGNATLPAINLPVLQRADVRLLVMSNAQLTSAAFPALTTSADGIVFGSNPALVTIDTPEMLITGHYRVEASPSVTSINAPRLSFATVNVELNTVPQLTTVNFDALTAIGQSLILVNAPLLADFTGFPVLGSIGGKLIVQNLGSIEDFSGLEQLTGVAGDMVVTQNASLTGFAGLTGFTHVDGNLTITSNQALPAQAAQAFASSITVKGSVTIN